MSNLNHHKEHGDGEDGSTNQPNTITATTTATTMDNNTVQVNPHKKSGMNEGASGNGGVLSEISSYMKQIQWSGIPSYFQQLSSGELIIYNEETLQNASITSNSIQNKDTVIWTHFAHVEMYSQSQKDSYLYIQNKLYLILSYTNGLQVLDVNDAKSVTEIASIKGSPVRYATVLSPPFIPRIYSGDNNVNLNNSNEGSPVESEENEPFTNTSEHPLLVIIHADDPMTLKFYSLKTHDYVHSINFKYEIYEVKSTPNILVVMDERNVYWFNPATLKKVANFPCYQTKRIDEVDASSSSENVHIQDYSGVIAIGSRWIAFPSDGSVTNKSFDLTINSNQTYAEISLDVAKKAASGIYYLGDLGVKKVSQYINPEKYSDAAPTKKAPTFSPNAGTVEIRDLKSKKLLAQFKAHTEPIAAMAFDPSGTLLITTSILGTHLNIYQLMPNSSGTFSSRNIRHIYRLFRGLTTARLKDIQFSINSKWVAVSSTHGTTHLFAINPTGGPVDPMTHLPLSYQNSLLLQEKMKPKRKNRKEEKNPILVYVVNRIHSSSSFFTKTDSNPTSDVYASKTSVAFFSPRMSENENIFICTNTGILSYYSLQPCLKEHNSSSNDSKSILNGIYLTETKEVSQTDVDNVLQVKIENYAKWNLCRAKDHDIVTIPIEWSSTIGPKQSAAIINESIQDEADVMSQWMSNVEIETYEAPDIPLWMSGYFKFKTFATIHENHNEALYPDTNNDNADDDYLFMDPMSKSVHIKVSEPIPISNYKHSILKKAANYEPSAPSLKDSGIMKAIQTPIMASRAATTSNVQEQPQQQQQSWEFVQDDSGLMTNSNMDTMRKSCLRPGPENGLNKMKKSVRLSIDTQKQKDNDSSFDQYFLNSDPTIEGISSQDILSKKDHQYDRVSTSGSSTSSSSTSPFSFDVVSSNRVEVDQLTANLVKVRSKSPSKKVESSVPYKENVGITDSRNVVNSTHSNDSSKSKMVSSISFLNENYFGNEGSNVSKSFIEQQTKEEYMLEDKQESTSTPKSATSYLSDHASVEKDEKKDMVSSNQLSTENIQHYEPQNMTNDDNENALTAMENEIFGQLEKSNSGSIYESDDEVEVKRSRAAFEINNNFFSKDKPHIKQAESFHEHNSVKEQDILQFSDMNSSNFSNFKSAYESQAEALNANAPKIASPKNGTPSSMPKDLEFEYDFESEDSEEEVFS